MTVWSEMKPWTAKDREIGMRPVDGGELVRIFMASGKTNYGLANRFDFSDKTPIEDQAIIGYQVEVKPKISWLNIYSDGDCAVHESKEDADGCSAKDRVACVCVTWHEGQFDKEPEE